MSEHAPYSRVYWSVVDDPKFAAIYDDDHHLATWLRLLIVAEGAYPASANIPIGTKRASITALVEAGLLDIGTGPRYRIHGLDAERSRRTDEQRNGGLVRMQNARRGPDGRLLPNTSGGPAVVTSGGDQQNLLRRAEQSIDETSRANAREDWDALDVYHELTGYRPWGQWSGDAIKGDINDYTDAVVQAALRTEYDADGSRDTLLKRVQARLARDADRAKSERKETPRRKLAVVDDAERARISHALMTGEMAP